jgi:hypothetical protein
MAKAGKANGSGKLTWKGHLLSELHFCKFHIIPVI